MPDRTSFALQFAGFALQLMGSELKKDFTRWRRRVENRKYPKPAPMPGKLKKRNTVQEQMVHGQPVYTIIPQGGNPNTHIIYTHGGAYIYPMSVFHWSIIHALIEEVGVSVTLPIYPLAPEHTYKPAFDELEAVYRNVLIEHAQKAIVLCGDSAGGGLALAQVLRYRDLGLRMPQRIVLFAPWLDISLSNPDVSAVEPQDVLLAKQSLVQCGKWWAGGEDTRSPLLSPLYADFSGLPPIDVFQGTADILSPDARILREKVSSIGGEIYYYEVPGAFHDFVGATFAPEAKDVYARMAQVLGSRAAA